MKYWRFWAFMGATFAWIAVDIWLSSAIDWPNGYGFHCRGQACLYVELWHSPVLIGPRHRHPLALFQFVWMWAAPAFGVWLFIWSQRAARRKNNSFSNLPE